MLYLALTGLTLAYTLAMSVDALYTCYIAAIVMAATAY
jgi:hypothetical protein